MQNKKAPLEGETGEAPPAAEKASRKKGPHETSVSWGEEAQGSGASIRHQADAREADFAPTKAARLAGPPGTGNRSAATVWLSASAD